MHVCVQLLKTIQGPHSELRLIREWLLLQTSKVVYFKDRVATLCQGQYDLKRGAKSEHWDDNCDGEHSAASMEVDRPRLQGEPRVAAQGCSAMDAPRQKKTRPSKRDLEENDGETAEGQRPEPAGDTYSSLKHQ